jgi:ATP-dependent DNA ligase
MGPAWPDKNRTGVRRWGGAAREATSGLGLEGVVAKKRSEPYRPGERAWVKVKHRHYWRFGQELERAQRGCRER